MKPPARTGGYHARMSAATAAASFPEPPEPGKNWVEVQGDVLWARLPVPGVLGHVNVWLLPDADRGWWLADSGMAMPAVEAAWAQLAGSLDLRGRLHGILVTHHHPDHIGLAAALAREHGIPVRCSAGTFTATSRAVQPAPERARAEFAAWAATNGLSPDDELRELMTGQVYRRMISGLPDAAEPLGPGDVVALASGWTVSLHEGHAPGHACFHSAADELLVSGDQVLPTISPNVSLYPGHDHADPLGQYLQSLRDLRRIPDTVSVLPAHGRPFRGLHARLDELAAEHDGRLRAIEAALVRPHSLMEVVALLFRVRLTDTLNRMLAIGETLAHLCHLELAGRVRREGTGLAQRWRSRERAA